MSEDEFICLNHLFPWYLRSPRFDSKQGLKGKKKSNICFIRSILHLEIWYAVYLKLWMNETAMVKQCKMYAQWILANWALDKWRFSVKIFFI